MKYSLITIIVILFLACPSAFAALDFDGSSDYVDFGNAAALDALSNFTISAWVKIEVSGYGAVVHKYNFGSAAGFILYAGSATLKQRLFVDGTSANSNTFLTQNTWHHIAVTYDQNNANFYIDGAADGTPGLVQGPVNSNAASVLMAVSSSSEYWTGKIDDMRIYNRILSASEIETLAKSKLRYSSVGNGLVAYWPLDDQPDGTNPNNGDTVLDRSGNGINGSTQSGLCAGSCSIVWEASDILSYPWSSYE